MPEGFYRASILLKPGFPLKHCGNDKLENVTNIIAGVIKGSTWREVERGGRMNKRMHFME